MELTYAKTAVALVMLASSLGACSTSATLPHIPTESIKAAFATADCNKDNALSTDELKSISISTSLDATRINARAITAEEINQFDANKNSKIEVDEMVKMYQTLKVTSDSAQFCST